MKLKLPAHFFEIRDEHRIVLQELADRLHVHPRIGPYDDEIATSEDLRIRLFRYGNAEHLGMRAA